MYVIAGEKGDTDYEEMIAGSHKTVIMKGIVERGSEQLLRGPWSYQREDVVPNESPLVVYMSGEIDSDAIVKTFKEASKVNV
jgi:sucrose-phosphate synthase